MSKLTVTIINDTGKTISRYEINVLDSLSEAEEQRRAAVVLDQIRIAAEVHKYYADFEEPTFYEPFLKFRLNLQDPTQILRIENVNKLLLEIENLLRGSGLNFAASRIIKDIEAEYNDTTPEARNSRHALHLDKMERFYLAVFELARVEDLVVRLLFEFFGDDFIAVDRSKKDWEKKLNWDAMKDALNKRGKPEKQPHPRLEAMPDEIYEQLMGQIRGYKTPQLLALKEFRDKRTHRIIPTVDYPELGAVLSEAKKVGDATLGLVGVSQISPEHEFLELYETAKVVYKQLLDMMLRINKLLQA